MKNSTYTDHSHYLAEIGFDCSALSDYQMTEVGMAAERAHLDWSWSTADDEGDEDRARRIRQAISEVKAIDCDNEYAFIANSVSAFFDDFRSQQ